jgi:uncharacterized protein YjiS (DUF1127 family)
MEVAMNIMLFAAPAPVPFPAVVRNQVVARRERTRFRLELKRMAKDNPHLIEDIGLTRGQAEEEIARLPFWQR